MPWPSRPFIGGLLPLGLASDSSGAGGDEQERVPPRPLAAAAGPVAVDPEAYALYNSEFGLQPGNLTATAAVQHYALVGRLATPPALCARVPVVLSYKHLGGLCNMALTGFTAWIMAVALGADVLLPRVHKREAFVDRQGKPFQWDSWEGLFHLPTATQTLSELCIRSTTAPWPRNAAVPAVTLLKDLSVTVPHLSPAYELPDFTRMMTREIVNAARQEQAARAARGEAVSCDRPPVVHANMRYVNNVVKVDDLALHTHLLARLRFSEVVEARANVVLAGMRVLGYSEYNAMHLRLEDDYTGYLEQHCGANGGKEQGQLNALAQYMETAKALRWHEASPRLPVYVASGLLTYAGGATLYARAVQGLAPYSTAVLHKALLAAEDRLSQHNGHGNGSSYCGGVTNGRGGSAASACSGGGSGPAALPVLHSEQLAAVDLLVVLRSHHFVGFFMSSFSRMMRLMRALLGQPATFVVCPKHLRLMRTRASPQNNTGLLAAAAANGVPGNGTALG